jgi:hypothetical protein
MTAMSVTYSPEKRREADGKWMLQESDMRLVAAPALNSRDGTERARYLDDLWRSSCEAPDAPHLGKV